VLQCVAVRFGVLQCVAVRFGVLQCVAVRFGVLQCVAVRFGVLQRHTLTAVPEHCYYSLTAVHLFELSVLLSNERAG